MRIFRKWRNYRQKPPFGAEIDWSDTITHGLVGCWLFNETIGKPCNIVTKNNYAKFAGTAYLTPHGLYNYGNNSYTDVDPFVVEAGSAWTVHIWLIADNYEADDDSVFLQQLDGSSTSGRSWLYRELSTGTLCSYLGGAPTDSGVSTPIGKEFSCSVITTGSQIKLFFNGIMKTARSDVTEFADGNFRFGNHKSLLLKNFNGTFFHCFLFNRALSDDEILRLHEEPYSFFLAPALWFCIDLGAGQSYQVVGNIPIGLIPSSVKEVRYYRQGEVPIVITPQAEKQAVYRQEGAQQISIAPQAEKRATYRKTGEILMQIGLAAEKQARYFSIGQIPIAVQVAGETKALYRRSGNVPLSLIPDASVAAYYRHEGNIPVALNVQADIACTFKVAGNLGFVLLPQGTWQYVPAAGGIVYTYEGNIPIAIMPQAEKKAVFRKTGQVFLNISPNAEMQAIYRPISELVMKLLPEGEVRAEWLIKGEIQLRVMPAGVAVLIRPSEQEDWYFVGVIEEDDIRAVFDEALHGVIWP